MNLRHVLGALLLITLGGLPAAGQIVPGQGPLQTFTVTGHVRDDTDQHELESVRVDLKAFAGGTVGTSFTRGNGEFEFDGVFPGEYYIDIRADGYEPFEETITVDRASLQGMWITLRRLATAKPKDSIQPVSAHELSIPGKPRGEFQKGVSLLYSKSDYKGAISQFQRAIKDFPDFYEAYGQEGTAYAQMGDLPSAEQALRKSIELSSSKYPYALFQLASLLNNSGHFAEAETLSRQSLALDAAAWQGDYELARALLGLKHPEEAEKSAIEARNLKPDLATVFLLLANIHIARRDLTALQQDLESYLKLNPKGPQADKVRQTLKQLQGTSQKAQDQSQPAEAQPKP